MDISFKGVRKKSRVKWEVELMGIMRGKRIYFWRTSSKSLTRDYLEEVGIKVKEFGCRIRQITFDWRRKL